jgi:hypothetical protein
MIYVLGTDLNEWIKIPELTSSNLVNVVHFKNDTLLFIYNLVVYNRIIFYSLLTSTSYN